MLKSKHRIQLNEEQRQQLLDITTKGKAAVRTFKRSQTLLLSDEGYKDQEIAERVGVHVTTVERTRQKFVIHGLSGALLEQPRCGRQRKLDGKAEAYLVATACSDAPEGRQEWTMQLLADRLVQLQLVESISDETVRQVLKKTRPTSGYPAVVEATVVHCQRGGRFRVAHGGCVDVVRTALGLRTSGGLCR